MGLDVFTIINNLTRIKSVRLGLSLLPSRFKHGSYTELVSDPPLRDPYCSGGKVRLTTYWSQGKTDHSLEAG